MEPHAEEPEAAEEGGEGEDEKDVGEHCAQLARVADDWEGLNLQRYADHCNHTGREIIIITIANVPSLLVHVCVCVCVCVRVCVCVCVCVFFIGIVSACAGDTIEGVVWGGGVEPAMPLC